jgi:hypothetical protein
MTLPYVEVCFRTAKEKGNSRERTPHPLLVIPVELRDENANFRECVTRKALIQAQSKTDLVISEVRQLSKCSLLGAGTLAPVADGTSIWKYELIVFIDAVPAINDTPANFRDEDQWHWLYPENGHALTKNGGQSSLARSTEAHAIGDYLYSVPMTHLTPGQEPNCNTQYGLHMPDSHQQLVREGLLSLKPNNDAWSRARVMYDHRCCRFGGSEWPAHRANKAHYFDIGLMDLSLRPLSLPDDQAIITIHYGPPLLNTDWVNIHAGNPGTGPPYPSHPGAGSSGTGTTKFQSSDNQGADSSGAATTKLQPSEKQETDLIRRQAEQRAAQAPASPPLQADPNLGREEEMPQVTRRWVKQQATTY